MKQGRKAWKKTSYLSFATVIKARKTIANYVCHDEDDNDDKDDDNDEEDKDKRRGWTWMTTLTDNLTKTFVNI